MTEQEKRESVIKEFKDNYRPYSPGYAHVLVKNWAVRDAIDLLKVQKPEAANAPKPDSDIGCWYDITHNYTLEQVINALKAQEPVSVQKKPIEMVGLQTWNWACGNCGQTVLFSAKFCPWCGQAVKWE